MKKLSLLFLLFILWGTFPVSATENIPYQIHIVDSEVQKKGNVLYMSFTLDFQHLKIPTNDQLIVRPVIIGTNDTLRLPYLLLPGKTRDKANRRKEQLYGPEENVMPPYATLYPEKTGENMYVYENNIPFQPWMYGARVELQQEVYGCADCHKVLADISLNQIANRPHVAIIAPRDTTREERIILYVNFPWDKAVIYPDYMNNTEELAKIDRVMQRVMQNRPVVVRNISLTGYASPEGTYTYNTRLAGRRLEAMEEYIRDKYSIEETSVEAHAIPEDWEGVLHSVDSSHLRYREEVMDIIANTTEPDARDNKIRRLDGGVTYRHLLHDIYPALRRVEYKIRYDVRPLALDQCREMWGTNPEKLSTNELYTLACSYPADSPEYEQIILATARLYPSDTVANNNAAAIALRRENLSEAREYLLRAGNSPQSLNNQGVLLLLEGNTREAYRCFSDAAQSGCDEGLANRGELDNTRMHP